ncbi:MAG TPA: anhydro-N-acetylmuramic acid kinase [Chloroflexaceae bacterium]|nr:anhydro-N-acetylmuramic acid kinase [Chloroflexaceae bacterium]
MLVIGLMSGTSLDAIDAALVELGPAGEPGALRMAVRAFTMLPYEAALRERIMALLPPHQGSTAEVCQVGALVGEAFARAALKVVADAGLEPGAVDLVASHGQTVWHEVRSGAVASTLQIGAPAVIAARTGRTVAADFRPADMAVGGQGAPLVPYLDALLFADPRRRRAVQNIGGIGNVTYLAPGAPPRAFDTGPGNVLIDEAVRHLTGGARGFDEGGRMAAAGRVDEGLLADWLEHPFFAAAPPRSTGRELFGPAEARAMAEAALATGLRPEDAVATITALTAWSIAEAYERYCGPVDEVILSGGGARNPVLCAMIGAALPGAAVRPADELGLDADAKEAVAFAVLGYAALHGWPANLTGATGASEPAVLGSITPGRNYRALLAAAAAAPPDPPRRIVLERA